MIEVVIMNIYKNNNNNSNNNNNNVKEFPLPALQVISTRGRLATGTHLPPCPF